jgi:excisionase family DNA binding protein
MPEKFYTIGEVARQLSVSRTTVYRWRLGSLKAVRVGGVVRVSESSLREFIADHNAREKQMGGA